MLDIAMIEATHGRKLSENELQMYKGNPSVLGGHDNKSNLIERMDNAVERILKEEKYTLYDLFWA